VSFLGDTLPNIYYTTFDNCHSNLYKVEGNLTYIGNGENKHAILYSSTGSSIENVHEDTLIIPERFKISNSTLLTVNLSNTKIDALPIDAFYNCSKLKSVVLGDALKYIKSSAFYNCGSLTSIEIPNSVTSIGNSAFYGCSSLTNV
jgi:hypothetical protein